MRRSPIVSVALLAAAAAIAVLATAAATDPPAAPAAPAVEAPASAAIVRDHCLTCHSEEIVRQQRLTAAQWKKTIDKMRVWGSTLPEARVAGLAAFLEREYGKDAGRFAPETLAAKEAAALFEPRPDSAFAGGDPGRGLALYADRCQACHDEAGRGGEAGLTIAGRRILDRPRDLADLIRKGRGDMPFFDETTDAEVADLVAYLRSVSTAAPGSAAK